MTEKIEKSTYQVIDVDILVALPFKICLIFGDAELEAFGEDFPKFQNPFEGVIGYAMDFNHDETTYYIVYLSDNSKYEKSLLKTLVHECVHVKQHFLHNIGDDAPSNEMEACFVEMFFGQFYSLLINRIGAGDVA